MRLRVPVAIVVLGIMGALGATAPAQAVNAPLQLSGASWLGGSGVGVCGSSTITACENMGHVGGMSSNWWQCVELAQRLYDTMGWHAGIFSSVGVAADIYTNASASGFTRQADGAVTSVIPGDMLVFSGGGGPGHVGIVSMITTNGNGTKTLSVVNQNAYEVISTVTWDTVAKTVSKYGYMDGHSTDTTFTVMGIVHTPGNTNTSGTPQAGSSIMFTNGGGETWANANPTANAWTKLSNSTNTISASGSYIAWIDGCGAAWATSNFATIAATQITDCSGATMIAIGSKGNLVFVDGCGSAHATNTYTVPLSWVILTGCGGTQAIAAGGGGTGEVALINSCGALSVTVNYQNWTPLTGCGTAQKVVIGPTGTLAFMHTCGATLATDNYTSAAAWVQINACGGTTMLAVGANKSLVFADGCGSVHGTMTYDVASSWVILTGCSGAQDIAMGTGGETGVINGCGALNVTANFQSWTQITPCSGALRVDVS